MLDRCDRADCPKLAQPRTRIFGENHAPAFDDAGDVLGAPELALEDRFWRRFHAG